MTEGQNWIAWVEACMAWMRSFREWPQNEGGPPGPGAAKRIEDGTPEGV